MNELVLEPRCSGCGRGLVVNAARHELGLLATFAVRCPACGARVPLGVAAGTVHRLTARAPNAA